VVDLRINLVKKHWPLLAALGWLWSAVAIVLAFSLRNNQGHLIYALDDPYIHMAMAKNFAQHGVWGVTRYEFSSSSSSPLWTLLISTAYLLFQVNDLAPFVLNFILSALAVGVVYVLLKGEHFDPPLTFISLVLVAFLTPLPALIFTGVEHILHTILVLLFVPAAANILSDGPGAAPTAGLRGSGQSNRWPSKILLLACALFLPLTRYESLFLLGMASLLFLFRKRVVEALALGATGLLPVIAYGWLSVSQGWFWLPNSVLLKGDAPTLSLAGIGKFVFHFGEKLTQNPHILILLSLALIVFILGSKRNKDFWQRKNVLLALFCSATLLHLLFASTGWFYRYEAYLVALGLLVIPIGARESWPEKFSFVWDRGLIPRYGATVLLVLVVSLPLVGRGLVSFFRIPQATHNIYEQQYQMGLFLKNFYPNKSIAANDIGAINYLADVHCLDLMGLANREVAQLKRAGAYDTQPISNLAQQRGVEVAIVYDRWFEGPTGLPSQWVKVGEWTIPHNVVCAEETVAFYAVAPSEADHLIENLRAFSPRLPSDVVQSGEYTRGGETLLRLHGPRRGPGRVLTKPAWGGRIPLAVIGGNTHDFTRDPGGHSRPGRGAHRLRAKIWHPLGNLLRGLRERRGARRCPLDTGFGGVGECLSYVARPPG